MNDNWRAAICVGVSFQTKLGVKRVFQWDSQEKGNFIKNHSGICLESMLHASTRAKTTPPCHYQQSSQMSICHCSLSSLLKTVVKAAGGGHIVWQVITEQSRAEAPLGISSSSGSHQMLTLHEGCMRSLLVKPSWGHWHSCAGRAG